MFPKIWEQENEKKLIVYYEILYRHCLLAPKQVIVICLVQKFNFSIWKFDLESGPKSQTFAHGHGQKYVYGQNAHP